MTETKGLLEEAIVSGIRDLENLEAGSEEQAKAISGIKQLYGLKIDEARLEAELEEKIERRELDKEKFNEEMSSNLFDKKFKNKQLKEQKLDRYFKTGVVIFDLLLTLGFSAAWMRRGFKFEETGTYTSDTFRWLRGGFGKFRTKR